jgi:hypothetical protein
MHRLWWVGFRFCLTASGVKRRCGHRTSICTDNVFRTEVALVSNPLGARREADGIEPNYIELACTRDLRARPVRCW